LKAGGVLSGGAGREGQILDYRPEMSSILFRNVEETGDSAQSIRQVAELLAYGIA
jgi:hypothetical protein